MGSAIRSPAPPAVALVVLACARVGGRSEAVKTRMKTLFAALALATLIAGPAFVTSADAAQRSVPEYDQPRANRDSDGSWRCYPYCAGGTYEGRPVREWLKPDGW
jgi:xanthosine utilization system XapX-like protein